MIKKGIAILGICGFALAGCAGNATDQGQNDRKEAGIFNESGSQLHTNNHEPDFYNSDMGGNDTDFGYVRYKRTGVMAANDQPKYEVDREQLANMISKLGAQVPNVDDVSTLVTDEEVLMVYASDSDNPNETAEQVKKMAMSVVPGWFHIYVSDDTGLRQNVENFATLKSNSRDVDALIDKLIKQMEKSPQGQDTADSTYDNLERATENNTMNTQQ
jgi:Sporulation lipoprotein YhcN/YlaJ (Spore_YhcN_YlaJ)